MNEIMLNESNYFSPEMSLRYLGASQFKDFTGIRGITGCEAKALAKLTGEWKEEPSPSMLVGSYVDAHFEGTLEKFQEEHPEIFTIKYEQNDSTIGNLANVGGGYVTKNFTLVANKKKEAIENYPEFFTKTIELKAEFKHAEKIIARIEKDPLFMQFMSGAKQVIMTAKIFGIDWKIKIDSYHVDKAIVDLKIMKSIREKFYLKDQGWVNFIEYWGYDYQAAIYQMVEEANTGVRKHFFITAASKEKEPDLEIIQIEQAKIDEAKIVIEASVPRIKDLKEGLVEPHRCETCDYCRSTKVLKAPIWSSELMVGL